MAAAAETKGLGLEGTETAVRPATLADRDEILGELSDNIYSGHDYLPHVLTRWLQHDEHHCFVAEAPSSALSDQTSSLPGVRCIVGFCAVGLFDDGTTAVVQALRAHPRARRLGIGRSLTEFAVAYAEHSLPGVVRVRCTTVHWHEPVIKLHQRLGFSLRTALGYASLALPVPFDRRAHAQPQLPITRCFGAELWALLETGDRLAALCPHGLLLNNWEPHSALRVNLERLEEDEDGCPHLASFFNVFYLSPRQVCCCIALAQGMCARASHETAPVKCAAAYGSRATHAQLQWVGDGRGRLLRGARPRSSQIFGASCRTHGLAWLQHGLHRFSRRFLGRAGPPYRYECSIKLFFFKVCRRFSSHRVVCAWIGLTGTEPDDRRPPIIAELVTELGLVDADGTNYAHGRPIVLEKLLSHQEAQ
ncbi:uncharacterized protein MONBRDRAFT_37242 [Monosiga brevicollis MX1]|uniref:N-acetyltransferase domain-containing protein n=1 Tax=Monosiga brevicollis TaxID=81824 RepID=A9V0H5_MONBE|nr:uncharacterized protein MONBRDRAFT_37242 [Monosiga brevicollis MX1]EDQ89014.1 predicted protein [Monosiga brevicollis MX1]|eukprot:XP_001746119.1 hypothetical protein [Monosiga brevicollis MX1]